MSTINALAELPEPTVLVSDDSGFTALIVIISDPQEAQRRQAELYRTFEMNRMAAAQQSAARRGKLESWERQLEEREKVVTALQARLEEKFEALKQLTA